MGNIGVVIFGMERSFVQLPITAEAIQGVERQITRMNRNMLLANVPQLEQSPAFMIDNSVEGLVLRCPPAGAFPSPEENEFIRLVHRYPAVWLFNKPENGHGDLCGYDTAKTVLMAVNHYKEMGHKHIAFINPRPGNLLLEQLKKHFFFEAPKAGLKTTLLEKERADPITWPLPAIQDVHYVKPLLEQLKAMPKKQRPTGLFVGGDSIAVQIYIAAESMGLKVGKDLSIISVNNEKTLTNILNPELTTVDVFSEVVGHRAVDQLIWRLQHPEVTQEMRVLVAPSLKVGKSVKKLN